MKSVERILARKFAKTVADSLSGSDILWDVLSDHVQAELEATKTDNCLLFLKSDGTCEGHVYYFDSPKPIIVDFKIMLPDVIGWADRANSIGEAKEQVEEFRAFADKISELASLAEKEMEKQENEL